MLISLLGLFRWAKTLATRTQNSRVFASRGFTACIPNKSFNGFVIASEMIHFLSTSIEPSFMLRLNLHKAFDALPPLLFYLVTEGSAVLFARAAEIHFWSSQLLPLKCHPVSYADDMLIFYQATIQQMARILFLHKVFSSSRLQVNGNKDSLMMFNSGLYSPRVWQDFWLKLSAWLINFLGLSLRLKRSSNTDWNFM